MKLNKFKYFYLLCILNCATTNYTQNIDDDSTYILKNVSIHIAYENYLNEELMDLPLDIDGSFVNVNQDLNKIIISLQENNSISNIDKDKTDFENELELKVTFDNRFSFFSVLINTISFQIIPSYRSSDIIIDGYYRKRNNINFNCHVSKKGKMSIYFGIFPLLFRPILNPDSKRRELINYMVTDIINEIKNECIKK